VTTIEERVMRLERAFVDHAERNPGRIGQDLAGIMAEVRAGRAAPVPAPRVVPSSGPSVPLTPVQLYAQLRSGGKSAEDALREAARAYGRNSADDIADLAERCAAAERREKAAA
jgi:hypothetical protein